MKLLIDDANINNIKRICEFYPIDGVTTNPSILAKTGKNPYTVLKEIRQYIGDNSELHVQTVARTAEGMVKDAHKILECLGKNTYIKIPAIPEGFKAMKILNKEGILITAIAIYTPTQALISAKCNASYVAPYINRIDNMGYNGIYVAKKIQNILKNNGLNTEILAASFKNLQQLLELYEYGIGAATLSLDVIESLVKNKAIDDFINDFKKLTENGKTMSDLL